jgi:hypothetical protein
MDPVAQLLVIVAGLLLIGALGEFIFSRTGIPDVVWLVLAGIVAGPVFEIVSPALLAPAVPFFGAIAFTVILSGGAYRLRLAEVAAAAPRALLLALVGFLFSMGSIYGYFWILAELDAVRTKSPLSWLTAGVIVAGNSALILMPTLAGAKADSRVSRMLEVESSATDALCIVLTMVLMDLLVTGSADLSRPFVALARAGAGRQAARLHRVSRLDAHRVRLDALGQRKWSTGRVDQCALARQCRDPRSQADPRRASRSVRPRGSRADHARANCLSHQVVLFRSDWVDVSDFP